MLKIKDLDNKLNKIIKILLEKDITPSFYRVTRPYCEPALVFTFAFSKKKAIKKVAIKYGGSGKSVATKTKKKNLLLFVS